MMLQASVILAATLAVASAGSPVNEVCMATHCGVQSAACFANKACKNNIDCAAGCLAKWEQDKTPEKFHVQNCTAICTFSYTSKAYYNFMACMAAHNCMNLPSIPNTCKAPGNITILKEVPITEMDGAWWVVRGYHPVYDCYPCQNDHLSPHNSTAWIYNPHYQVYLANKSLGLIDQSGYINTQTTSKAGYSIVFEDAGVGNVETWWVVDKADDDSYYLVYYCGYELQWYFEGAIVLSKNPVLSTSAVTAITESYKKAVGLDFKKFCSPRAGSSCPDQPQE